MRTYREEATVDPVDRPTWVDGVDNPYLHGPYTPVISEITAVDLPVTAGEIPADLCGAYMRNGPNPVLEPKGCITGSTATAWCTRCISATVAPATSVAGCARARCATRSSRGA